MFMWVITFEKQSTASQLSREINVDGMIYNSERAVLAFQCRFVDCCIGFIWYISDFAAGFLFFSWCSK